MREFIAIPKVCLRLITTWVCLSPLFCCWLLYILYGLCNEDVSASHHKDTTTSVANLLFCLFFVVYNLFYLSVEPNTHIAITLYN